MSKLKKIALGLNNRKNQEREKGHFFFKAKNLLYKHCKSTSQDNRGQEKSVGLGSN
jgi:hypothetical protein